MKKILVVGAGGQGGPCASILSRTEDVSEIRLGDINAELAQKVADKIGSRKVKPLKLDASRKADIAKAATDVDANIDASGDFGWIMEITVDGSKDGEKRSHCLTDLTILDKDTKRNLHRTFGTSHIGVALPAVVGAIMCLQGDTGSGVISSECLDPAIFFKKIATMGLPFSFEEKITKQISFN